MGAVMALFGIFLILPLILTLSGGFESKQGGFTTYHILEVFRDPLLRAGLVNSLWIAIAVTALCLLISLPLAFLDHSVDGNVIKKWTKNGAGSKEKESNPFP